MCPPSPLDPDDGPWRRVTDPPEGREEGLRPTVGQLRWQVARAHRPLATAGAITASGSIAWTEEESELLVLRRDDDPLLIEVAARTAAEAGLRGVRAWDTGQPWPTEARVARRGAVPMVLALGAEVALGPVARGSWV